MQSPHPHPSPPPTTFPFPSLPIEIQQKIWLLTFTPRILNLQISKKYHHITPNYKTIDGIVFNCTVLPSPSTEMGERGQTRFVRPGEISEGWFRVSEGKERERERDLGRGYDDGSKRRRRGGNRESGFGKVVRVEKEEDEEVMKVVRENKFYSPVALHVCHLSRELALKKYEMAFKPCNFNTSRTSGCETRQDSKKMEKEKEETKNGVWDRRIWIDFKNDVVMIDASLELMGRNGVEKQSSIDSMRRYCPQEIRRIERLAVGGRYVLDVGSQKPWFGEINSLLDDNSRGRHDWLEYFPRLRELFVDDSYGMEEGLKIGGFCQKYIPEEKERVRKDAADVLGGRIEDYQLDVKLAEVKIVRGDEWREYC